LLWAQERSTDWIIAVACDMPFVEPALLELLADGCRSNAADVIAPASRGPRGLEPLCAAYRTTCIESIRASIERDDPRMIGFHRDVRVDTLPLDQVSAIGDPDVLFMNVNTPADLERAAAMIERKHADA
jgi:molybdopterin-guanine dinucleotide biosynthesis protein A